MIFVERWFLTCFTILILLSKQYPLCFHCVSSVTELLYGMSIGDGGGGGSEGTVSYFCVVCQSICLSALKRKQHCGMSYTEYGTLWGDCVLWVAPHNTPCLNEWKLAKMDIFDKKSGAHP